MPLFPTDFLDADGRFRDLLPADFVPILYLAADGGVLCAACAVSYTHLTLPTKRIV